MSAKRQKDGNVHCLRTQFFCFDIRFRRKTNTPEVGAPDPHPQREVLDPLLICAVSMVRAYYFAIQSIITLWYE